MVDTSKPGYKPETSLHVDLTLTCTTSDPRLSHRLAALYFLIAALPVDMDPCFEDDTSIWSHSDVKRMLNPFDASGRVDDLVYPVTFRCSFEPGDAGYVELALSEWRSENAIYNELDSIKVKLSSVADFRDVEYLDLF